MYPFTAFLILYVLAFGFPLIYLFLYIRDARNKGGIKKGIINWIGLIAFILFGLILLKYLSFALVYFIPLALIFILLRKPTT